MKGICSYRLSLLFLASAIASFAVAIQAFAADYYVSPAGAAANSGSRSSPLDLQTALNGAGGRIKGGDTVYLLGGVYLGAYTSNLVGSQNAPIVVRQAPGERATIDAATAARSQPALVVNGSDTWFWGFEVTDSSTNRTTMASRATSIYVLGARTKFINLIVHDGQMGYGIWVPAVDAEIYGNVIYNVGVEDSDRGHGHSIYIQNDQGTKHLVDNIMFNGFSFGIHCYTEGAKIDHIEIVGNTSFNHGILSATSGAKANYYMGGRDIADFNVMRDNMGYMSPFNSSGRDIDVGHCNQGTFTGNYMAGGTSVNLYCTNTSITDNTFIGWTNIASTYPQNSYLYSRPTGLKVFVRPNLYELGRGNITIYNWDMNPTVDVDVSAVGLKIGQSYRVQDAQNYFGPSVASGVYDGKPIRLPMRGLSVARPVGNIPIVPSHTTEEFGAFVIAALEGGAPAPLPSPSPSASPAPAPSPSPSATPAPSPSASPLPVNTSTSVAFVKQDAATQGNWKGAYGADGYSIVNDATSYPAYAEVSITGSANWTWDTPLSVQQALQRASLAGRIAATAYSTTSMTLDVAFRDSLAHQVALYSLDYDGQHRAQKIEVLDAANGQVLDTQSLAAGSFQNGLYSVWNISGHVKIRVTNTGPLNAVISGIFFGQASQQPAPAPSATPSATPTPSPTPSAVPSPVAQGSPAATFVKVDSATQGTWKGNYGSLGYDIVNDSTLSPKFADLKRSSVATWTWDTSANVAGLQLGSANGRIEATMYSATSFDIDLNIKDGQTHQVAVYCLDFDRQHRSQTLQILDAVTGQVLDSRSLAADSMGGGVYVVWNLSGSLKIRVVNNGPLNAVVSGLFFD